jgi:ribosomal protein S18 acetylase RimI-like enzyme
MKPNIYEFIPQRNPEELAKLLDAYLQIWNQEDNRCFLSYTGIPFQEDTVRTWFETHLDTGVRYHVVIDEDEEIIGIAVTKADTVRGFELVGIGVRSKSKRQGIGGALITHATDFADQSGYKAVDLKVFADNTTMLRLVLSQGFIPVDIDHHRRADGADIVYLKKFLRSGK